MNVFSVKRAGHTATSPWVVVLFAYPALHPAANLCIELNSPAVVSSTNAPAGFLIQMS